MGLAARAKGRRIVSARRIHILEMKSAILNGWGRAVDGARRCPFITHPNVGAFPSPQFASLYYPARLVSGSVILAQSCNQVL
jgi:hypothetical protein